MKPGKAAGPSEICAKIIFASGEVGISVIMEWCQCMLDGKGVLYEWQASVLVLIFKAKEDVRNCNTYRSKGCENMLQKLLKECWKEGCEN